MATATIPLPITITDTTDTTTTAPVFRTNASLNLSVLRRHNPQITDILSIAPYAVIYTFNSTLQTWEKSGTEGTLFVCRLHPVSSTQSHGVQDFPIERYAVIVLNRRGLENFELELTSEEDVEITPEYVILQAEEKKQADAEETPTMDGADESTDRIVYGLWIFAEPAPGSTAHMREVNAGLIQDCAIRAEASRRAVAEAAQRYQLETSEFGQGGPAYWEQQPQVAESAKDGNGRGADVLGDLFRRARQGPSNTG